MIMTNPNSKKTLATTKRKVTSFLFTVLVVSTVGCSAYPGTTIEDADARYQRYLEEYSGQPESDSTMNKQEIKQQSEPKRKLRCEPIRTIG